jgi:hypothetical protein
MLLGKPNFSLWNKFKQFETKKSILLSFTYGSDLKRGATKRITTKMTEPVKKANSLKNINK